MKNILFGLALFPVFCFGQVPLNDPGVDVRWDITQFNPEQRSNVNCGTDTIYYIQAKTTAPETKILYSDGTYSSQAGQYFWASSSTPITVHGFRWYGYSYDPVGGGSPVIDVDCSIYQAGSDSLPTGAPLATETVSVDANPSNAQRDVVFSTPVAMTGSYILVISSQNTDWLFLSSNDEDVNDGAGEELSSSYYEPASAWVKNMALWALGDFDFIVEPFVTYTMDARFDNPGTGCVGIPADFNNTSKGPIEIDYYNQDKFYGNPISYHWDYGDGNSSSFQKDGQNAYAAPGIYTVLLTDTIFTWTGFCEDTVTHSIEIFPIPSAPSASSPPVVCEYDTVADLTATGTGTDFTWYDDSLLNIQIGTGSPFSSNIFLPDTVYVTETVDGCESPGTPVVLDFLSNPIPAFSPDPQGGTQVTFNGAPVASTYAWDFGDSLGTSTFQNPTYTYAGAGPYTACLDVSYSNGCTNQHCEVVSFVGVEEQSLASEIIIYPNPVNTTIYFSVSEKAIGADFEISDVSGRLVTSGKIRSLETRIRLGDYSRGLYIISFKKENASVTYRIVKK